jgi:hypothetical protein
MTHRREKGERGGGREEWQGGGGVGKVEKVGSRSWSREGKGGKDMKSWLEGVITL